MNEPAVQTSDLEAECDRLRRVVDAVRGAFVRSDNDERWYIADGALVELADSLDALDAVEKALDTPRRKRPEDREILEHRAVALQSILDQIAVLVATEDEPLELIEPSDLPDLINRVIIQRDRLHKAATLAVEHLGQAIMPAPSILVAMSSYLRAALQEPDP